MTHDIQTPSATALARGRLGGGVAAKRSEPPPTRSREAGARSLAERRDDLTIRQCEAWLRHQAEACRLSIAWGQVEARLQAEHGWYRMSPEARAIHPGQGELDAIQARLEELDELRDGLLPTLADLPATGRDAVALKLSVVAELVDVADFPEAHALIVRAREEMLAF